MRITAVVVLFALAGAAEAQPQARSLSDQWIDATTQYASEQRQPAWAQATENRILDVIRAQDPALSNVQLECRATTCRLQFTFRSPEEGIPPIPERFLDGLHAMGWPVMRVRPQISEGAGSAEIFITVDRS